MQTSMLEIAKGIDQFFLERSPIHDTMRRLAKAMAELRIPFAIAGAMAANAHGHKRTTSDVNILIRREDLQTFKNRFSGLGWVDKFEGSRNFKDATNNINVDTLIVGDFPGDGLPKPISFPPPESISWMSLDGLPYIDLTTLIELKVASGMTTKHRPRDLDDVIQLIRINQLPESYGETLNPDVRDTFKELWQAAQISEDY